MGSLRRMPSGNLYEGFPCVRVGDYLLPSSMDLRAPPGPLPCPCCAHCGQSPMNNREPMCKRSAVVPHFGLYLSNAWTLYVALLNAGKSVQTSVLYTRMW